MCFIAYNFPSEFLTRFWKLAKPRGGIGLLPSTTVKPDPVWKNCSQGDCAAVCCTKRFGGCLCCGGKEGLFDADRGSNSFIPAELQLFPFGAT